MSMKRSTFVATLCAAALLAAAVEAAPTALAAAGGVAGKPDPSRSIIGGTMVVVDSAARTRREGHPAIFLSWGAPYGLPRAREAAVSACDDTTAADTLYLTFDPGEDVGQLMGIGATLKFRAAPGDSLGPFWQLSRTGANPWNLRIEFDEPPDGVASPWPVSGMGAPSYRLTRDTGRLDLTYFINATHAGPVAAGTRYFYARVILRLRRPYLRGCAQPVCVELDHLKISYAGGGRWINTGQRFTSWNSPGGEACIEAKLRPPDPEPLPMGGRAEPDTIRK